MNYENFIQEVRKLDFMQDDQAADSAIKAVLGILASRMEEPGAKKLTENLPNPLTLEKLRGHQATPTRISADDYVSGIADEFSLDNSQSKGLINKVLHVTKDTIGQDTIRRARELSPGRLGRSTEG